MTFFKTFCCCNTLRAGGITVGLFGLVKSLAIAIGVQIYIFNPSIIVGSSDYVTLEVIFGFSLIYLVASFQLIIGTLSGKHRLLLPWLITQFVFWSGFIVVCVANMNAANFDGTTSKTLVLLVFVTVSGGYVWLCIFSLFQELKNKALAAAGKAKVDESCEKLIPEAPKSISVMEAGHYI